MEALFFRQHQDYHAADDITEQHTEGQVIVRGLSADDNEGDDRHVLRVTQNDLGNEHAFLLEESFENHDDRVEHQDTHRGS